MGLRWGRGGRFVLPEASFELPDLAIGDKELIMLLHVLENKVEGAFVLFGLVELSLRGDDAEIGVDDHVLDQIFADLLSFVRVSVVYGHARESAVGDLQAVEHHAGAADVHGGGGRVLSEGGDDLADGETDGVAVFEQGQSQRNGRIVILLRVLEAGTGVGMCVLVGATLPEIGYGWAGGVMVVAEIFAPKARTAAAMAASENVTALEAGLFPLFFEEVIFGGADVWIVDYRVVAGWFSRCGLAALTVAAHGDPPPHFGAKS